MKHRHFLELIDSYLLGQISQENKKLLLDKMEAEPDFAQFVKESEEAFTVLQYARQRALRQKLKAWDAADTKSGNRKKKGLLILLILVFLVLASWCWLAYYYSPVNLAKKSFHDVNLHYQYSSKMEPDFEKWQNGMNAFGNEDFENAILLFKSVEEPVEWNLKFYKDWNILLCQLALHGADADWQQDLDAFSKQAPEPFRSAAKKLLKTIQSPLYSRLFQGILKESVTSVKPKII
jgi:flagellar basal body-associated protein FliL